MFDPEDSRGIGNRFTEKNAGDGLSLTPRQLVQQWPYQSRPSWFPPLWQRYNIGLPPQAQTHPDLDYGRGFCNFRMKLVTLALREYSKWRRGGNVLKSSDMDAWRLLYNYWDVTVVPGFQADSNAKSGQSLLGKGPYASWGGAWLNYLIYNAQNNIGQTQRFINRFSGRNIVSIVDALRNRVNYVYKLAPSGATPFLFSIDEVKNATVALEVGDVLCYGIGSEDGQYNSFYFDFNNLNKEFGRNKKIPRSHTRCELIISTKFKKSTNQIVVVTLAGDVEGTVKRQVFYYKVAKKTIWFMSANSTVDTYEIIPDGLPFAIMKFPSCSARPLYRIVP
jgi:hypothetical protein